MGGHYLIAKDFCGPDKDDHEVQLSFRAKLQLFWQYIAQFCSFQPRRRAGGQRDPEASLVRSGLSVTVTPGVAAGAEELPQKETYCRDTSTNEKDSARSGGAVLMNSQAAASILDIERSVQEKVSTLLDDPTERKESPWNAYTAIIRGGIIRLSHFLQIIFTVPATAIVIAFVISVIPALKGLFVLIPSSPKAPDGQPPLAFIMDTANFLGGASVPLGLIGLGSALARLHIPRSQWGRLPLGSIFSLAVGRMVLQPVLGVLIVKGLTNAGVIPREDKVLQFVAM